MDESNRRTRRTAWSFASGLTGNAATVLVSLAITPMLLRLLGTERFGAFRASLDALGYLGVLEFGLGGALPPLLIAALATTGRGVVAATVAMGMRAYVRVMLLSLIAGAVLVQVMPSLVPVRAQLHAELFAGCLVGLASLLLLPLQPFRLLISADQRDYVVQQMLVLQSLTIMGTALLLARAGFGLPGQFGANLLGQLAFSAGIVWFGARRSPGVWRLALQRPSSDLRADLRRLSLPTFVASVAGRISFLSDNVVAAVILGPVAVVPLVLTVRLPSLFQSQLLVAGNASWAALGDLHARGEHQRFQNGVLELTGLLAAGGAAALVPVVALNRQFVALWVGPQHFAGDATAVVAAVSAAVYPIISLWATCFSGTGHVGRLAPIWVANAVVNVGLSVLFTIHLGVVGPPLGTLAALALTAAWALPLALRRAFGIPTAALVDAAARPLLWGGCFAAAAWAVSGRFGPLGWGAVFSVGALSGVLFLTFWWFVLLKSPGRARLAERARAIARTSRA